MSFSQFNGNFLVASPSSFSLLFSLLISGFSLGIFISISLSFCLSISHSSSPFFDERRKRERRKEVVRVSQGIRSENERKESERNGWREE